MSRKKIVAPPDPEGQETGPGGATATPEGPGPNPQAAPAGGENAQAGPDTAANGNNLPPPAPPATAVAPEAPDPFDPTRLRLDQNFGERTGVKKLLTTVPVQKPTKEAFIRTHPDPGFRLTTGVIELKDEREVYLVDPSLWPAMAGEATFTPKLLVTAVTRQGVLFVWPIRLPGADGKIDNWNRSALEAADTARDHWVRVAANMHLGAYDVLVAGGIAAEPAFPGLPMKEVLRIAFKDRFITELDHPVLRKLRGEL